MSPLHSEVVFRDIPGKLVQWRRQSQRLRRLLRLRRAPVNSPGDGIAWVPVAPPRLRLLPAPGLTFWLGAGPLPDSYSRIRPEPPAADGAWSLPGLWHRDDLSLSSRAGSPASGQNAWVTFGEHRWVNFPERRSRAGAGHGHRADAERQSRSARLSHPACAGIGAAPCNPPHDHRGVAHLTRTSLGRSFRPSQTLVTSASKVSCNARTHGP